MDFLVVLGWIVILAGIGGAGYFGWRYLNSPEGKALKARLAGYKDATPEMFQSAARREVNVLPTDAMVGKRSFASILPHLKCGQAVTLTGESRERGVSAVLTLVEMEQKRQNGPWVPKGAKSVAIVLSGDIWLMRVPETEGGAPKWLKFKRVPAMGLRSFFQGGETPETYGPARAFGRINKQTSPYPYKLPKNLLPDIPHWEVVDIGCFHAQVDGECETIYAGDLLMFVTSREQGGDRWTLYLDPRREPGFNTQGSGGFYYGEPFDPEVEVSSIL